MPQKQYQNIQGIIWMLVNSLATVILYAMGKQVSGTIHSLQVVFLYKLVVLLGVVPYVLYTGINCIKTQKIKLHFARGFFSSIGGALFFYGLSKVDIGNAIALSKLEPIFLMIISIMYFKEKLTLTKSATFLISFIGMVFITYPVIIYSGEAGVQFPWFNSSIKTPDFDYNYLIILGAMLSWSINSSLVKMLGKTESNRTQLFYVSVFSVILTAPLAAYLYEESMATAIDFKVLGVFILLGLLYFAHASCYFRSLKIAEMSVVIPYDYSKLLFGAVISYFFFSTNPSISSYIGYFLVLASGVYLFKSNVKAQKSLIEKDDI